jgi:hypothetical protein
MEQQKLHSLVRGKHLVWQKRRKICQCFSDDICFLFFILWGAQRHLPSVEHSVVVPLLIPELPVVPETGNRKWIICSFFVSHLRSFTVHMHKKTTSVIVSLYTKLNVSSLFLSNNSIITLDQKNNKKKLYNLTKLKKNTGHGSIILERLRLTWWGVEHCLK